MRADETIEQMAPRSYTAAYRDKIAKEPLPELPLHSDIEDNVPHFVTLRKKVASCSSSMQRAKTAGTEIRQIAFELERKTQSSKPRSAANDLSEPEFRELIKVATQRQKESRQLNGAGKRFQQHHDSRTPRHLNSVNISEFRLTQENFAPLEGEFALIKRPKATSAITNHDTHEYTRASVPYLLYHNTRITGIPMGWQSNVGDETKNTIGHLSYCNARSSEHLTCSCQVPYGARILGT